MRATRKKCGLPAEMRVPAEIRVTRRDAGTRSHAGKNPQKPETRTPVTRNYPKPDFSTRNPSLPVTNMLKCNRTRQPLSNLLCSGNSGGMSK